MFDLAGLFSRFFSKVPESEQHVFCQYVGDDTILTGGHDELFLYLDGRDASLTPCLLRDREWEPAIRNWLALNVRLGTCFVDIGGNIGFHALTAARHVGSDGLVVAFEPQERLLNLFKRSISANVMSGYVHGWRLAIGDRHDHVHLGKFEHLTGSATLTGNELIVEREAVEMVPLPLALERVEAKVGRPCVPGTIKIDVEGFEVEVWEGMKVWTRGQSDLAIILEFSPVSYRDRGNDPHALLEDFAAHDFSIALLERDGSTRDLPRSEWVDMASSRQQFDLVLRKGA
ncbi:FkbM family methyltransferase [Novosphingobium sediminicola]|uniref:FkbM family methyltransferase n=1 Tax=Novosphingobium sediminicola TaxID=563162 RepID=A0A7W6CN39_9SPHN|nr:FkbM family methyltransferase [Novosphingobium sediminicola]MBB3954532.1 FkbM family methyltransferase [Novosphingobium sediminicola]